MEDDLEFHLAYQMDRSLAFHSARAMVGQKGPCSEHQWGQCLACKTVNYSGKRWVVRKEILLGYCWDKNWVHR